MHAGRLRQKLEIKWTCIRLQYSTASVIKLWKAERSVPCLRTVAQEYGSALPALETVRKGKLQGVRTFSGLSHESHAARTIPSAVFPTLHSEYQKKTMMMKFIILIKLPHSDPASHHSGQMSQQEWFWSCTTAHVERVWCKTWPWQTKLCIFGNNQPVSVLTHWLPRGYLVQIYLSDWHIQHLCWPCRVCALPRPGAKERGRAGRAWNWFQ